METEHYIDTIHNIATIKRASGYSERKLASIVNISKSEIHRLLVIDSLPNEMKEAAKTFNIQKWVLLDWSDILNPKKKKLFKEKILSGEITTRRQFRVLSSKII